MKIASYKSWLIYLFLPVPFLFYLYTCLPSIGLGDSAMLVDEIQRFELNTYVNIHNITILIGWVFQFLPFGDLAYRANLVSVFAAAACVGIFFLALNAVHRCWITALVCSLFLMLSHSLWWMTSSKQEHAVDALFIAISIYLYVQLQKSGKIKYLYYLFVLSGLGFFNNMELGCIFGGTSMALLWRFVTVKEERWPVFWKAALCFCIGFLPYFLTFLHDTGHYSVSEVVTGAIGGKFKRLFFKGDIWFGLKDYARLVFTQFPSLFLVPVILGPYFFFRSWKISSSSVGITFTFLPIIFMFITFNVWDKFLFMNPSYIILCFCSSFAVYKIVHHRLVERLLALRVLLIALVILCLGWNFYFYSHLSRWGQNPRSVWFPLYSNTYYFNCYRGGEFQANPNKRNFHDIEEFCNLIFARLPQNAEYWDDDSRLFYQLTTYYRTYYHRRPDLDMEMTNSWGFEGWGSDKNGFAKRLRQAYKSNKDFFIVSLGHPFDVFLQAMPDRHNYIFQVFKLDDKRWIYKLVTEKELIPSAERTQWDRKDILPSQGPVTIDLKLHNVLNFNEGEVLMQENMATFGPYWMDNDQVFFIPSRPGSEVGFLLKFAKAFRGKLVLHMSISYDFGMAQILLNDEPITKQPVDLYSHNSYFKDIELDHVPFEKGNNILSIKMAEKNPRSGGLKMGIDTIKIIPE